MPPPLLLAFSAYFRRTYPAYELTITELSSRTGSLAILPDHIDAAMGAFPEGERLRHVTILDSRRFVVAAHRDLLDRTLGKEKRAALEQAALAGRPVQLSWFRDCPFILKRQGSIIRANEDRVFRAAGFTARGRTETGDLELSVRMTLLGEAALYLPEPMARANFDTPELPQQAAPILLCPVAVEGERWALTVAHPVGRPLSPGAQTLINCARDYYGRVLGPGAGSGPVE